MLVPEPKFIRWADVCRDGGTYVLVYDDRQGAQHELELPVIMNHELGRIGYNRPTIRPYLQDNTRESLANRGEPIAISWQDAAVLAKQLAPLLMGSIEVGGIRRAAECIQLLALEGRLP